MVKKSIKQLIFFVMIFCTIFLILKLSEYWKEQINLNTDITQLLISLLCTFVIISLYYITPLTQSSEKFWDVSEYAKCRGGSYMWQGESSEAKLCQDLANTPEGRCGISSYNCPVGYNGIPKLPFEYTPLTNDEWENERCDKKPKCPCVNNEDNMTSTIKQVE